MSQKEGGREGEAKVIVRLRRFPRVAERRQGGRGQGTRGFPTLLIPVSPDMPRQFAVFP